MKRNYTILLMVICHLIVKATTNNVPSQFSTIQEALDACSTNDTVLVDPGTYNENINWPAVNGIKLLSAGDSSNTIIDGGQAGRVLNFPGNGTIDTSTVIQGFKITNGFLSAATDNYGAGIYIKDASPKFVNVSVTGNKIELGTYNAHGAGVFCNGSNAVFRYSSLIHNVIDSSHFSYGGGLFCEKSSNVILDYVVVSGNSISGYVNFGGGIAVMDSSDIALTSVFVTDNTIAYQHAGSGGGVYSEYSDIKLNKVDVSRNILTSYMNNSDGSGGGIHITNSNNSIFDDVLIADNVINSHNSASGGGITCEFFSSNITNVKISGNAINAQSVNSVGNGAGICIVHNAAPKLTNVIISENINNCNKFAYGGGIFVKYYADPVFTNVLIASNVLKGSGNSYFGGGIASCGSSTLTLMNVTIANNKSDNDSVIKGSGIFCSTANITNSIVWDNNSGLEIDDTGAVNVTTTFSDFRGGWTGTGNINSDPMFVSATDFHLLPGSPCINAGTLSGAPVTDLENNTRPMAAGTNPDLGCYEYNQPLGVKDWRKKEISTLECIPNPFSQSALFKFNVTNDGFIDFRIYDISGKEVKTVLYGIKNSGLYSVSVDLSDLHSGIYLCKLISGDKVIYNKIVKSE